MRWLRFLALIIFVVLCAWAIPVTFRFPSLGNILVTLAFVIVAVWVGAGFLKGPKQRFQQFPQQYSQIPQ